MTNILSSSDVWVVYYPGMTSIDKIYLDKELAEIAALEANEAYKSMVFSNLFKMNYIVRDLYDAIDLIKDSIELEASRVNDEPLVF